jgi:hypothetical protein
MLILELEHSSVIGVMKFCKLFLKIVSHCRKLVQGMVIMKILWLNFLLVFILLSGFKMLWFFPKIQKQLLEHSQKIVNDRRLDHELTLNMRGMEIGLAGMILDSDKKEDLYKTLTSLHGVWGISVCAEALLVENELPSAAFVIENKGHFWQANGLVGSVYQKELLSAEFKSVFPQVSLQNELVVQSGLRSVSLSLLKEMRELIPRYSLQKIQFAKNRVHLTIHYSLAADSQLSEELKHQLNEVLMEVEPQAFCFPEWVIEPKGSDEVQVSGSLNGIMDLPFLMDVVGLGFPQAKINAVVRYVPKVGSVGAWVPNLSRLRDIMQDEFGVLKVIGTEDGRILVEAELKTSDLKDKLIRAARGAFGHSSVVRAKVLKIE